MVLSNQPFTLVRCAAAGLTLWATAATAADRPAPDYYLAALINTTTAQQLALSCPTLSVDLAAMADASGVVINKLEADGFTMTAEQTGMTDSADALAARQDAFVAKHGLTTPSLELVCAAGKAEIAEGTTMGSFLIEVQP